LSLHWLVSVLLQVVVDCSPPILFTQVLTKHVKDCTAAWIRVSIKNRVGFLIVLSDDRSTTALLPCIKVRVLIRLDIRVKKIIRTEFVFIPHRLEVGGKAFVQPNV